MSRSYKKPWIKDRAPGERNLAARAIRRIHWSEDIPNGKAYRKFYNPWNISDWTFSVTHPDARCAWNSFIEALYQNDPKGLHKDKEEARLRWVKHCGNRRALRLRYPPADTMIPT